MTYLVDRRAQLRRHLRHLQALAPTIGSGADLDEDQSRGNDVLFSLLMVAQSLAGSYHRCAGPTVTRRRADADLGVRARVDGSVAPGSHTHTNALAGGAPRRRSEVVIDSLRAVPGLQRSVCRNPSTAPIVNNPRACVDNSRASCQGQQDL